MSQGKIEIAQVTFDFSAEPEEIILRVCFCEWRRNGEFGSAYHDEIPDDVRIALALLVAPGLLEVKGAGK